VARLEHPAKNHVRLIEAFTRFKRRTRSDWQLVFGGGDWHGAEFIHEAVRRSPLRAGHLLPRFCAGDGAAALVSRGRRLCLSLAVRGIRPAAAEAMACGCPVVCSARGGAG